MSIESQKAVCSKKGEYNYRPASSDPSTLGNSRNCECLAQCRKRYLDLKSPGTKTYRKLLKEQTSFRGCQSLEEDLVDDSLVVYVTAETLGAKSEIFEELTGHNSLDWHHVVEFENVHFFMTIADGELDEYKIYPEYLSLLELRAIEWWILEDRRRDEAENRRSSKRFGQLMREVLTAKQREVVQHYWIDNDEGLSIKEVAEKLNISLDSFRDRLEAGKKKIKAHYPERSTKPKINTTTRDLYHNFWRQSEHYKVHLVSYKNYITGHSEIIDPAMQKSFRSKDSPSKPAVFEWLKKPSYGEAIYNPINTFDKWQREDEQANFTELPIRPNERDYSSSSDSEE